MDALFVSGDAYIFAGALLAFVILRVIYRKQREKMNK